MGHNSSETLLEALNRASLFLQSHDFPARDAQTYYMFYKDWSLTDLVQHLHLPITANDQIEFQKILDRLVLHEPIQYILGYADFAGLRFKVTPDTLIPREETEGILEFVSNYFKENSPTRILDIGTGTGALAVTLKKQYMDSEVWALDISSDALAVADDNSLTHQAPIHLIESDLLANVPDNMTFDLIVSNPPYIGMDELDDMDESVKQFEPKLALFAEQGGYGIYQRLSDELAKYMASSCLVVLEIGWRQGNFLLALFQAAFLDAKVSLHQDFNGHDRYIVINQQIV